MNADIHVGELIEELIRVNQLSISEVARRMHVNRRSVYNWFKQKSIRPYVLHRICNVLASDFSIELPLAMKEKHLNFKENTEIANKEKKVDTNSVSYWMNKYIYLLEKYNEVLSNETAKEESQSGSVKGYRYIE